MPSQLIPNEQLVLARIPDPEADLASYKMGGFEACADLANSGTPTTLTELRASLFFEARRDRWNGGFTTDEQLIRDLLRAIRQKVEAGELD